MRLFLSACIITSLLPFDWVGVLDAPFLLLFALEFGARCVLVFRGYWDEDDNSWTEYQDDRFRWPPPGRTLALFLDLIALLSFLPIPIGDGQTRWLRVFRLSRMLLLVGYWAPLVRDLWTVLVKRERARQVVLMGGIVAGLSFAGTVVLDNIADGSAPIDFNGDGMISDADSGFFVELWWAFRQIQDPGNMVQSPNSTIAVVVSVVLTIAGLMLVSFLIGLGTDVVRELLELSRLRPPGFTGHSVLVNVTMSTRFLLHELLSHHRKLLPDGPVSIGWVRELIANARTRLRGPRYVVVGKAVEAPDFLRHDELSRVLYREGSQDPGEFARRADVHHAQRVVYLADHASPDPDADTIHGILTLVESMRLEARERWRDSDRVRLLIAEILDESNVAAARAAISAAGRHTRSFIVPTERLIALFVACVARRPAVGRLLEELLTSQGHEIYTCFFDLSGLGYSPGRTPELPAEGHAALAQLRELARRDGADGGVLPIGLLVSPDGDDEAIELCLNPQPGELGAEVRVRGFVAVAPNFGVVRDFCEGLYQPPRSRGRTAPVYEGSAPRFVEDAPPRLEKVLIGGFRSATVGLVESLLTDNPGLEMLILVPTQAEAAGVFDDFDAHNRLQLSGLMKGEHASFPRREDGGLGCVGEGEDDGQTRIRVAVGDQSSSRRLMSLPHGFGSLGEVDAVILVSGAGQGADAHTTKTLMKIEALLTANSRVQRVVAEVRDADLASRLRRHYRELGRGDVVVYSIQELRSYFMFQSVVVPGFDLVYQELLGSRGHSLHRLELEAPEGAALEGRVPFSELDAWLDPQRDGVIVGCEFGEPGGATELVTGGGGSSGDGQVELSRLRAVWTVAPETRSRPS